MEDSEAYMQLFRVWGFVVMIPVHVAARVCGCACVRAWALSAEGWGDGTHHSVAPAVLQGYEDSSTPVHVLSRPK